MMISLLMGVAMFRILLIVNLVLFLNVSSLTAESVDTHQFGFLQIGSPVATVVSRIGPPDEVVIVRKELRVVRAGVLQEVVVERWIYAGNRQGKSVV